MTIRSQREQCNAVTAAFVTSFKRLSARAQMLLNLKEHGVAAQIGRSRENVERLSRKM